MGMNVENPIVCGRNVPGCNVSFLGVQVVAADVEMNNHVACGGGGGINVGVTSSETSASVSGSAGWCGDSAEDTRSPSLDRK